MDYIPASLQTGKKDGTRCLAHVVAEDLPDGGEGLDHLRLRDDAPRQQQLRVLAQHLVTMWRYSVIGLDPTS